jgi:hypothetical protein
MLYIFDPTLRTQNGKPKGFRFNTSAELIRHLEGTCMRILRKSRAEIMQDAADLGYSVDDDREGKAFFQFMEEYVDMGVIREDGKPIRCNIFTSRSFEGKTEFGD